MACRKSKTIEEIDDLSDMFQAMAALGISCRGLQSLDEMKSRVKTALNQSVEKPCWSAGQVRTFYRSADSLNTKNSFKTGNAGDFVLFTMKQRVLQ